MPQDASPMGKGLDVAEAVRLVRVELGSKRTLAASMARLERGAGTKVGVSFSADASAIADDVKALVAKLRPTTTGLCFFLDRDAITRGRGIEVLACTGYDAADADLAWAFDAKPGGRIASAALRAAYVSIAENPAEYAVCFGYLGLALRDALRALVSPVVRVIAWGHHGGDFFLLGELGPKGLRLRVEADEKTPSSAVVLPKLAAAPRASRHPRDWLVRAGLLALTNTARLDGVDGATWAARDLVDLGARSDAIAIARAAAALGLARRGMRDVSEDMLVGYLADCAEVLGVSGERDEARALLDEACTIREGLDDFWKEQTASDLVDAARAFDAVDVLRRRKLAIPKRTPAEKKPSPRAAAAILRDAEKELARDNRRTAHSTFSWLLGFGKELHARKDRVSLAKLTKRADETAAAWKLEKGWAATGALSDLAVLHFLLGDEDGTEKILLRAERAATAERGASMKETVTLSLRSAFEAVGQPDRPFTVFRPPPSPWRDVTAAIRRGALVEADRRIAEEKDPEMQVDLLRVAAAALQLPA